ncbi:MAG: NAD(P)-binding oxidoreductase [Pseudomonadota bacterium]
MKLVVLGANGGTGHLVVREALTRGDRVTAIVRAHAKRPSIKHSQLTIAVGDPCDPKFLATVFEGQDAVISTLGGRRPTRLATSVYWRSADAIVEAAQTANLRHVAVTSSALLFPRKLLFDKCLATLVRPVLESATRMEETLGRTDLDVIVARCGFLTNADDARYRAEPGSLPLNGSSVSRLALARFLTDAVREPGSGTQIYGVAGPMPSVS